MGRFRGGRPRGTRDRLQSASDARARSRLQRLDSRAPPSARDSSNGGSDEAEPRSYSFYYELPIRTRTELPLDKLFPSWLQDPHKERRLDSRDPADTDRESRGHSRELAFLPVQLCLRHRERYSDT